MMNKFIRVIITTALCITALTAIGCGGEKTAEKQIDTSKPIKIGVTPGPHV